MSNNNRRRLPNRRFAETFEVEAFNLRFTVTIGRFDSGGIAEAFIQNHKASSAAGVMANEASIAASLALQFGCPLDVLRKALKRDGQNRAMGPLGCALDLIAAADKAASNTTETAMLDCGAALDLIADEK